MTKSILLPGERTYPFNINRVFPPIEYGPPTRGLQGIWFLGSNNLLLAPGDLTAGMWVKVGAGTGSAPVVTAGQTDPQGASTAFRLQLDIAAGEAAEDSSMMYQNVATMSGVTGLCGVWMKSYDASTYVVAVGSSGTGVFSYVSITPEWQQFEVSKSSWGDVAFRLRGIYPVSKTADILVWHPQLNAGSSLFPFEDRGTQQTLPIYRGTAGTLQRGATTGAESSDPGLLNSGLSFVTDDYVLGQNLANVTMAGDWTAYAVGLFNGTSGNPWSLATSADDLNYQTINYNGSGKVRIASCNDASAASTSSDLTVSTTSPTVLIEYCASGTITLERKDTGVSVSLASRAPTGTTRMGVGALVRATIAPCDAFTGYAVALANVAHNAAERARMCAWLKSELAKPPYGLAVL